MISPQHHLYRAEDQPSLSLQDPGKGSRSDVATDVWNRNAHFLGNVRLSLGRTVDDPYQIVLAGKARSRWFSWRTVGLEPDKYLLGLALVQQVNLLELARRPIERKSKRFVTRALECIIDGCTKHTGSTSYDDFHGGCSPR